MTYNFKTAEQLAAQFVEDGVVAKNNQEYVERKFLLYMEGLAKRWTEAKEEPIQSEEDLERKFHKAILTEHGNLVVRPLAKACVEIAKEYAASQLKQEPKI